MRVLVIGAYGFIGRYVAAGLLAAGHELCAGGRDLELGRRLLPKADWRFADFNKMPRAEDWRSALAGIDAVVNCAGILDETARDTHRRIHIEGPAALFAAAHQAGIRRVIQISATGTDDPSRSRYAAAKSEGDAALKASDLDWVVLRPSLVLAPGSYGGSKLMRALAGLPFAMPLIGGGRHHFQPVGIDDLVRSVAFFLDPAAPKRLEFDVAGPATVPLAEIMRALRQWLGFRPAPILSVPGWAARPLLLLGDFAGWLGLKSAFRSASFAQLEIGNSGDPEPLAAASGIRPRALGEIFALAPSTLEDRLHARSALAMLLLRLGLGLFWIATGLIAYLPASFEAAEEIVSRLPILGGLAAAATALGAAADILLGLAMLVGWRVRLTGLLMIALTGAYLVAATIAAPGLWLDPLGPLVKALPTILATLAVMAYQEKR